MTTKIHKGNFYIRRRLSILILLTVTMIQSACRSATTGLSTSSPTITNEPTMTNTLMSTETPIPSQTPSPTPRVAGIWSEEPPLLMPRSAHAVVSSDTAIYALAGTDDKGQPVLEVEAFDGKQW